MMRAAMVMVVVAVLVAAPMAAKGELRPSQCKHERDQLVSTCLPLVSGENPSANCCQRIRVSHYECVCPYVTPKVAYIINVRRTIKQIQGCGRTVPHNFKCGSITTP